MRRFLPLLLLGLCACSPVYKLSISQGNVIDDAKLAKLEPGMSPEQVRYLMGTPLVTNEFEPARWDYAAYFRGPDGNERQRVVTVYFDQGVMQRIEDSRAAEPAADPVPSPDPVPEAAPDAGLPVESD